MKARTLHVLLRCWLVVATLLLLGCTVHAEVPVYGYQIVKSYPHNPRFFTQGLLFHDGYLYEGTGRYGQSALMQIRLEDGEVGFLEKALPWQTGLYTNSPGVKIPCLCMILIPSLL
jgi:glutamine cyclotransferase